VKPEPSTAGGVPAYAPEDTGPAGGPACYELEYLLVRVRR
jgi:hypothetical protein